jgi:hypothetical protein
MSLHALFRLCADLSPLGAQPVSILSLFTRLYQLGNGEHYHIACLYDHLIILLAS